MQQLVNRFFASVVPQPCMLCKNYITNSSIALCDICITCIPKIIYPCKYCGINLANQYDNICGTCIKKPWPFSHNITPFIYNAWLGKLLGDYKYHSKLGYGYNLTKILISDIIISELIELKFIILL